MTRIALVAATLMLASTATFALPQQAQTPPAQAKPEAKPTGVAGKWNMMIDSPQGPIESQLEIKLEGIKVTGTLNSPMGGAPIVGEFADGKLEFTLSMDAGGTPLQIWFGGAMKEDGTMAGTLDFGQGEFPWTAKRAVTERGD